MYRLCELLDSMLDMAPLRQNAVIVLAVSAELIPRLWYGALKVCVLVFRCLHSDDLCSAQAATHLCLPSWRFRFRILASVYFKPPAQVTVVATEAGPVS